MEFKVAAIVGAEFWSVGTVCLNVLLKLCIRNLQLGTSVDALEEHACAPLFLVFGGQFSHGAVAPLAGFEVATGHEVRFG
jgi:hypothetical protein